MTDRIRWVGHSTVLVELDGVRLLTDPLLRERVVMLRRTEPLDVNDLGDLDAVLVSHIHYDHLDIGSLRRLDEDPKIVLPRGASPLLRRRGFDSLTELEAGEETTVGALTVRAVHAEHDSARLFGLKTNALGYVISGSKRVYFLGDTGLFPAMAEIAPGTDVALVPIWGWGPSLGEGHLDPQSAAEAARLISPTLAVPIHWGTYYPVSLRRSEREFLTAPPLEFAAATAELAPDVDVRVLPVGGSLEL